MRSFDHLVVRTTASLAFTFTLTLTACGRSSPDGGTDAAEIETAAKLAAFDTEEELTLLLDDNYLAADTDLLDAAEATVIATDVSTQITSDAIALLPLNNAATFNEDLRAELDPVYLAFDTTILDVGDVAATAQSVCFDTEAELVAELDDQYVRIDDPVLPVDFGDLVGVPADLADGDQNTVTAATLPLEINGSTLAIDTTGCVNGEALVFQGGAFSCLTPTVPATPASASAVPAGNARPFEALPIAIKTEVTVTLVATTFDTVVYNATFPAPRNMLLIDAWAVATVVTGTPTWHLRDGAGIDLTTEVPIGAAGDVTRIADFSSNVAQRTINTNEQLLVRITGAVGETANITVFMLALPL